MPDGSARRAGVLCALHCTLWHNGLVFAAEQQLFAAVCRAAELHQGAEQPQLQAGGKKYADHPADDGGRCIAAGWPSGISAAARAAQNPGAVHSGAAAVYPLGIHHNPVAGGVSHVGLQQHGQRLLRAGQPIPVEIQRRRSSAAVCRAARGGAGYPGRGGAGRRGRGAHLSAHQPALRAGKYRADAAGAADVRLSAVQGKLSAVWGVSVPQYVHDTALYQQSLQQAELSERSGQRRQPDGVVPAAVHAGLSAGGAGRGRA